MNDEFEERLVLAFERIATALEGIHDQGQKAVGKLWPERKGPSEAIVSRVPTDEDKIREAHGASDKPIGEWLTDVDEYVGPRELAFRRTQNAGTDSAGAGTKGSGSAQAAEDQAGTTGGPPADNATV